MKKLGKILLTIVEAIIVVYVIVITTCLLCTNKFGQTQFGNKTLFVATDENLGEVTDFENGDLVIFEGIKFNKIEVGDTVYYYDSLHEQYIIRKGTVKEKLGDSVQSTYVIEETNATVEKNRVVGKNTKTYENLGSILNFLVSRIGFLFFVILPILLLLIYQIYKMVIMVKYEEK